MKPEFRTKYLVTALNAMEKNGSIVDKNLVYLCDKLEIEINPYNITTLIADISMSILFVFAIVPYTPNDECATIRLWDSVLSLNCEDDGKGTFTLKGCILPQGKYKVEILMSYVNMEEFGILCQRICIT